MPTLPRIAAVAAALAVAALAPAAAAHAATPATVHASPAEVSRLLFVAGDVRRLAVAPSGTVDTVLEQVLQAEYQRDPGLDPAAAAADIAGLRGALGSGHTSTAALAVVPGNQRVLAILAALERAQSPARVKRALARVADRALTESSNASFDANADQRSTLLYGSFSPASTLRTTADLAADDPAFGRARDMVWAAASHESVFSDADALVAGDPDLQTDAIHSLLAQRAADGSLTASVADLESLVRDGLQTVDAQTATVLQDHADVARTCPGQFCDYYTGRAQSDGQAGRTAIAAQQASLTATAMLLAQVDAGAGRALLAEAQGAAQVADQVNAYYATRDYGQYEKIASDAAGLVIGLALVEVDPAAAVIGTINVVSDALGGALHLPDANELILQGLQGVSKQLAGFADATAMQFRAVDARLEGLSEQVSDVARDLSTQLGEAQTQLSTLGDRISTLQTSVDRLQSEIQTLFNAQATDALRTTIDQSVGFAARNRDPLSPTAFATAAESLFSDAASIASSPTVANTKDTLDAATAAGVDDLNAYLNFFAAFAGGPADSAGIAWPGALGARLPNPDYWATAARAYAQLLLENRGDVVPGRLTEFGGIEAQGTALEQALARIGAHDDGDRGTGSRLFNAALDYYSSWIDGGSPGASGLLPALQAEVARYVKSQTGDGTIDPWGGAGQVPPSPADLTHLLSVPHPQYPQYELSGTSLAHALVTRVPAQVLNAVRLGLGSLRITWDASFPSTVERGGFGPLTVKFHYLYTETSDGTTFPLDDLSFTIQNALDCTGPGSDADADAVVQASWSVPPTANGCPNVPAAAQAAAAAAPAQASPALLTYLTPKLDESLRALQSGAYQDILGTDGKLTHGIDDSTDVAMAAQRLGGAQSLIDAYVTLGLPQALTTDDALHGLIAGDAADALRHPFFDDRSADPAPDVPGQVAAFFAFEAQAMPQSSPFPALETLLNRHRQALQDAIAPYVKTGHGTVDDGALDEANPLVRSTLDRLELTRAVLQDGLDNPPAAPGPPAAPVTPATPAAPAPAHPAPATPARARIVRAARVHARTIALTVGCQTGTCRLTVTGAAGRRAVVGRVRLTLRAGSRRTVVLRLNAAGRRLLARRGRVGVTVRVALAGRARPLSVAKVTVR